MFARRNHLLFSCWGCREPPASSCPAFRTCLSFPAEASDRVWREAGGRASLAWVLCTLEQPRGGGNG